MGQRVIKRRRRANRERLVRQAMSHLDWCMKHMAIRDEDGTERPVTLNEAAEFIYLTSHQRLSE